MRSPFCHHKDIKDPKDIKDKKDMKGI